MLLAFLLFIPLLTLSLLFVNSSREEIHKTELRIKGIQFNSQLSELIQRLQLYRGTALLRVVQNNQQLDKLENLRDSIHKSISLLDMQAKHLHLPQLQKNWTQEKEKLLSLLKQNQNSPQPIQRFTDCSHEISQLLTLMKQSQYHFKLVNQKDMTLYLLNQVIFNYLPSITEELGYIRGLGSYTLAQKNYPGHTKTLLKEHYFILGTTLKNLYTVKPFLNTYKTLQNIQIASAFLNQLRQLTHNRLSNTNALNFFKQSTQVINRIHNLNLKLFSTYENLLNRELEQVHKRYYFLLTLISLTLFLAFYFFIATSRLHTRNLNIILKATGELTQGHYCHDIITEGNDEFQTIAMRLNTLASVLSNDHQIIDNYVLISKTDIHGVITHVTTAFCQLTGYTKEELIGKTHALLRHPDNSDEFFQELWETILSGKTWQGELKNLSKKGTEFWAELTIIPLFDNKGNISAFTSIRKDITAKKIADVLATTDALTGLYNRKYFDEHLALEMEIAKRYDQHFSLIMIDIDHFKEINDTFGHHEGDEVLRRFSDLISHALRKSDTFARWGGEEFIILLPHTDIKTATKLAESLRTLVENFCKSHRQASTISLGVTEFDPLNDSEEILLKRLDKLLYKAKTLGRNRVVSSLDTVVVE